MMKNEGMYQLNIVCALFHTLNTQFWPFAVNPLCDGLMLSVYGFQELNFKHQDDIEIGLTAFFTFV